MSDLDDELDRALDHAFDAFATGPPPRNLDACLHCVDPVDVRALANTPPRQLHPALGNVLAANLGLTLGDVRAFRWFAPMLLRFWRDPSDCWGDLGLIAGRFHRMRWLTWPSGEIEAVRGVWMASFRRAIAASDPGDELSQVLLALEQSGDELAPYVAVWAARWSQLPERDRCLAHLRTLRATDAYLDFRNPSGLGSFLKDPERLLASWKYVDHPSIRSDGKRLSDWIDDLLTWT